jgi:hypothetical protein
MSQERTNEEYKDVRIHLLSVWDDGFRGQLFLTQDNQLTWVPMIEPSEKGPADNQPMSFTFSLDDIDSISRFKPRVPGSGVPAVLIITKDQKNYPQLHFHNGDEFQSFWAELGHRVNLQTKVTAPATVTMNDVVTPLTCSSYQILGPLSSTTTSTTTTTPLITKDSKQEIKSFTVTPGEELQSRLLEGFGSLKRFVTGSFSSFLTQQQGNKVDEVKNPSLPSLVKPPVTPVYFPLSKESTILGSFIVLEPNKIKVVKSSSSNDESTFSTTEETTQSTTTTENQIAQLKNKVLTQELPLGQREQPLKVNEFLKLFDAEGKIKSSSRVELFRRAFYGGFSETVRKECWLYLLQFYPAETTEEARKAIMQERVTQYEAIRSQWSTVSIEQEKYCRKFRERREQILKDIVRTDREYPFFEKEENITKLRNVLMTYTCYNSDLGYVQGMNDYVAIVLSITDGDEAVSFWLMKEMMDRRGANFRKDQSGMHLQLRALNRIIKVIDPELYTHLESVGATECFFAFRWMLVLFKREFSFDTTKRLWEAIFSNFLTPHFDLFVAAALIYWSRDTILSEKLQFDGILGYLQGLSGRIPLDNLLIDAERLFLVFLQLSPRELKEYITGGVSSLPP